MAEVVLLYDKWMDETRAYSKAGKATTQRGLIRVALRELNRFAGDLAADEFTSATLVAHRDKLASKPKLSAQGVNRKVGLIKQFVAWAAERGHMPETNAAVIRAVRSLRVTGKKRREPVPLAELTKAIEKLRPHFADMVRLQFLLGCRPGEVCGMRWDDLTITDSAEPWRYLVVDAKTSHHGVETVYWIHDEAKEILRRHIRLKKGEFVFRTKRRARFDTKTLTRKIRVAARAAGVPEFTAHQIRHLALTLIANHPNGAPRDPTRPRASLRRPLGIASEVPMLSCAEHANGTACDTRHRDHQAGLPSLDACAASRRRRLRRHVPALQPGHQVSIVRRQEVARTIPRLVGRRVR